MLKTRDKKIGILQKLICFLISGTAIFGSGCISKKNPIPEGMVLVPGGEFVMGTNAIDEDGLAEAVGIPEEWFVAEHPERKVNLPSFYIDKYEVTNNQYKKFIEATGHNAPPSWNGSNYLPDTGEHPVTYVNFYDASEYAKWAGKRLPTEEEWEKAARGTDGRLYPWGMEFDKSKANLTLSTKEKADIRNVGSFPQGVSPFGVHDMAGNVWEWTESWYEAYPGNSAKNSNFGKKYKVLRGFSFYEVGHFPDDLYNDIVAHLSRSLYREIAEPIERNIDMGFRCVKDV